MKIRAARSNDLDAIRALLAENGLPASDVNAVLLNDFVVAEGAGAALVGSVELERFGRNALLRSLAVCADCSQWWPRRQPAGACGRPRTRVWRFGAVVADDDGGRLLPAGRLCGGRPEQSVRRTAIEYPVCGAVSRDGGLHEEDVVKLPGHEVSWRSRDRTGCRVVWRYGVHYHGAANRRFTCATRPRFKLTTGSSYECLARR